MNQTDKDTNTAVQTESAGSASGSHVSLENVHGSISVPDHLAGFWKQWRAFVGPAILVSVGYMDPGNWGTDLQGGAQFKYGLLWVVGLASLMAIFMQVISARLGVVTGKDLAQCCRDWYPKWTRWPNWLMSEVAIGACDLAEVLGSAVALNLRFIFPCCGRSSSRAWTFCSPGLAAVWHAHYRGHCVAAGGDDQRVLLHRNFRSAPDPAQFSDMGRALVSPHFRQSGILYLAIGIIGATVMPHNLYLHSALVQSRKLQKDEPSVRSALRFNTIDSVVALTVAFFVNAAILVLAATVFFGKQSVTTSGGSGGQLQRRQRLDTGSLSNPRAAARNICREHAVCSGPARKRPKQHHHGDACRASGDGRLHALANQTMGAAPHHPLVSDPACRSESLGYEERAA